MEDDQRLPDPSPNVQLFVGNVKDYLEKLQEQGQKYFEDKLQLAIEASRRERLAETNRIDACRRDDLEAVKTANQASIEQAKLLANNLVENAETLRASMSKTAETIAEQLQSVTKSLDERLKIVEEKQYSLAGASKGRGDMWGWVSAGIFLIIAVVSFILK